MTNLYVQVKEYYAYGKIDVASSVWLDQEYTQPLMYKNKHDNDIEYQVGQVSSSFGWAQQDISLERHGENIRQTIQGDVNFIFELIPYHQQKHKIRIQTQKLIIIDEVVEVDALDYGILSSNNYDAPDILMRKENIINSIVGINIPHRGYYENITITNPPEEGDVPF